jgi:hypothetical protein
MKLQQYRAICRRWAPRVLTTNPQAKHFRDKPDILSVVDAVRAATILATPGFCHGQIHYWRSIEECIDSSARGPELEEICATTHVRHKKVHRWLTRSCKESKAILKYGRVDQRDRMPPGTREGRRTAAKIWRQELPYAEVEDGKSRVPEERHLRLNASRASRLGHAAREKTIKTVTWKEILWLLCAFQYDAFTICDKEGAAKKVVKGYSSRTQIYEAEEVRAGKSVGSERSMMIYIITHSKIGLICPPSIMYWASDPTYEGPLKGKLAPRHDPQFKTWCALCKADPYLCAACRERTCLPMLLACRADQAHYTAQVSKCIDHAGGKCSTRTPRGCGGSTPSTATTRSTPSTSWCARTSLALHSYRPLMSPAADS